MTQAIEADGISKRYRIGQMQAAYGTLRDSLVRTAARLTGRVEPQERPRTQWSTDEWARRA